MSYWVDYEGRAPREPSDRRRYGIPERTSALRAKGRAFRADLLGLYLGEVDAEHEETGVSGGTAVTHMTNADTQ